MYYFCRDSSSHASRFEQRTRGGLRVYIRTCFTMKYTKKPLTIEEQIAKLKQRGLIIIDDNSTANYLANISYYRLRAYTFPFQDNNNETNDHHFFRNDISFKDILDLYCFDRRLRLLILNALEKIEVVPQRQK